MSEQSPPAGWYPDREGNLRYWSGAAWTEHVRQPEVTEDKTKAPGSVGKKPGALAKFGATVKKSAADKQAAKEELNRKQGEYAQAAGGLITSGVFGTSTVEVYEGGYVRVAAGESNDVQPSRISKSTPFERLRSIKFTQPSEGGTPHRTSMLESAVGPAVTNLVNGGRGLMKSSAPGMAMAGLAHLAGAEGRKSFLTIVTDKEVHSLVNASSNGFSTKSNKGHNEVGVALEAAGNATLGIVGLAIQEATPEPRTTFEPLSSTVRHLVSGPTLAERLRELAELHRDGIISDEEFAGAKAKLLGGL